ncbi:MAG: hypothetical protein WD795_21705 [Woeseia sp.]
MRNFIPSAQCIRCAIRIRPRKVRRWPGLIAVLIALTPAMTVSAARIVYLAEQEFIFVTELFVVDLAAPGVTTRLNRPLSIESEGVASFAISPDGARIVFSADQTTPGDPDLFLLDIAAPGRWTRLGSLPARQREMFAKFSPDGSRLAFTASDPSFADTELYLVDLADPGHATRLNSDLVANGAVSLTGFEFTPDGSRVVYVAAELENRFELYVVDVAAPGLSVRLNAPGGNVGDTFEGRFRILPDSRGVVYSAVSENPGVRELHVVAFDRPGQATTLNAPLQGAGDIFDFSVSADGRLVAYTADQDRDTILEVFIVDVDFPGTVTKINGPVQSGAALARFTPDGKHLIYSGDEERGPGERDLYIVAIDQPVNRVRLNATPEPGADIGPYAISADGGRVAYKPAPPGGFETDLMVVRPDSPGIAAKVNGPLPNGALDFQPPKFSPDGEELAFLAVESLDDSIQELFFARVSGPGASIRLNGPLPPGAVVAATPDSFEFLPAGAPPTGDLPPGTPPPEDGPGTQSSGGGSLGPFALLLLLVRGTGGSISVRGVNGQARMART